MLPTLAHVKWFVPEDVSYTAGFDSAQWLLISLVIICGLLILKNINSWFIASGIQAKFDRYLKPYKERVPLVVRFSTALLLIINIYNGYLLAPNVTANDSLISLTITILFALAAVFIAFGILNKVGVALLLAGYSLVFTQTEAINVLEHFEYIGIAGYLLLRGPGKYTLGKLKTYKFQRYALNTYRISAGIALVTLALSEKLLNVAAAQNFLNQYNWNFMASLGVTDGYFILIVGSVELILGLALILNYAPRLIITVILTTMVLTASILGIEEIFGHLFAVGLVAAIWVNDKPKRP